MWYDSPCQYCTDRWIDIENAKRCHSTCEKFITWREEEEVNDNKRNAQVNLKTDYISHLKDATYRYKHGRFK